MFIKKGIGYFFQNKEKFKHIFNYISYSLWNEGILWDKRAQISNENATLVNTQHLEEFWKI